MKKETYLLIISIFTFCVSKANTDNYFPVNTDPINKQALVATINNNIAELTWQATIVSKIRRYEIEKSQDGNNFSYLTAVAANTGNDLINMTVVDRNVDEGYNYYRIKTIFKDGSFSYQSNTAIINTTKNFSPVILPKIVEENLYIWMSATNVIEHVNIFDATGRLVVENAVINKTTNLTQIQITSLPPGAYYADVITSKHEIFHLRFANK